MPDLMTVILPSLVAIILMVIVIRLTGIAHPIKLEDEAQIKDTMNAHFEGEPIERIVLGIESKSALVFMQNGAPPVLVRALGDRLAVRKLTAQSVKSLNGEDTSLTVKLRDYTWPDVTIHFANAAARTNAQDLITTLATHPKEAPAHA
jgi:hypothetical protein